MTQYELSGTSRVSAGAYGNVYQYYKNGILHLSGEGENLLSYMPSSWHGGTFIRAFQEALGMEFERALAAYEDVQSQMFVETATWGLKYWEQMLGLPAQTGTSEADLASRRTLVLLALARTSQVSEYYFVLGLQALVGADITVTPLDPQVSPYAVHIELPINYYEDPPVVAGITATEVAAGTMLDGVYTYKFTNAFTGGETEASGEVAITIAASKDVQLENIPRGPEGTIARHIYRKKSTTKHYAIRFLAGDYSLSSVTDVSLTGAGDSALIQLIGLNTATVAIDATGGNWTFTNDGNTTANLAHDISATSLLAAIEALPNIEPGDVTVVESDYVFLAALDQFDTSFLDTSGPFAGPVVPRVYPPFVPTANTALTALARQAEEFIEEAKPAHLHITSGSTGFRAGYGAAGDPI